MDKVQRRPILSYLRGKSYRYILIAVVCISALMLASIFTIFTIERRNAQRYQSDSYDRLKQNSEDFCQLLEQCDQIVDTLEKVKYSIPFFSTASSEELDAMLVEQPEPGLYWLANQNSFAENSNGHKMYSWLHAIVTSSTQVQSIILYAPKTDCALGTVGERFFLAHNGEELRRVFQTDVRWPQAKDKSLILVPDLREGEQSLYYMRRVEDKLIVLLGLDDASVEGTLFMDNVGASYKVEQMMLHLPNGGLGYLDESKNISFLGRTWDVLSEKSDVFVSNTYTVMRYDHSDPTYTLAVVMSETGATKIIGATLFAPFVIANALWLLLVAGICIYVLVNFNRPIEEILRGIRQSDAIDPQADQLRIIESTIEQYHQDMVMTQEQIEAQRRQLRSAYLGKLAIDQNTYLSEEQLAVLGIPELLRRYFVIVLYPANGRWIAGECSDQEQAYQRHVKILAVMEAMRSSVLRHAAVYLTCHAKLLIVVPVSDEGEAQELWLRAVDGAESIGQQLGCGMQIGRCRIYEGKERFSHAYRNALRNASPVEKRQGQPTEEIHFSDLVRQNMHIADLIYVEHYEGAFLCFREVVQSLFRQQDEGLRREQIQSFLTLIQCMLTETSEMNETLLEEDNLTSTSLLDDEGTLLAAWQSAFEKLDAHKSKKNISQYTEQFAAIYQYMHGHFREPDLSQSMLAAEFGMSPSTLSREFQKNIGKGFLDCLHQIRVEAARYEIEHSNASMLDIAESVGYTNALTMTRAFKKYLGNTPGSYRKNGTEESEP